MCFDHDALPPDLPGDLGIPPLAGGAGAEMLELASADGARFSAALAQAPSPGGPAVVVIPDVRGLHPFYAHLCERFAQAGHHAIAIDPYGRTAGLGPRDGDFEYAPHMTQTHPDLVQADCAAARDALRERTGEERAVIVGFCFGGMHAFLAATNAQLRLEGVVGFYGALKGERFNAPNPPDVVGEMKVPVLGLFGGADHAIAVEDVQAFDDAMTAAGVEHEVVIYDGAPHSFFDKRQEEYADASADAWRRVLGFLGGGVHARSG